MTTIESVTLEVAEPTAVNRISAAVGLETRVHRPRTLRPTSGFPSTTASRWPGASAANTSSSVRGRYSWRPTSAEPWPSTPASHQRAADRTGSRLAATPAASPTRTDSRGKPPTQASGTTEP